MLEKLYENHSKWLSIALSICRNKTQAEDYVQDMYLKLHDFKGEVRPGYVYQIIRSMFIDDKRANKITVFEPITVYDPEDNSSEAFDLVVSNIEVDYEELAVEHIKFDLVKGLLEELAVPTRKENKFVTDKLVAFALVEGIETTCESNNMQILRLSYRYGLREFCRKSGISIDTVSNIRKSLKIKVCNQLKTTTKKQAETLTQETLLKIKSFHAQSAEKTSLF